MQMKRLLPLLLLPAILFASCDMERIKGNGNIKSETRNVGSFDQIHVSGNIYVYFTQGAAQPVRVETDDNLQEFIEVQTSGDILNIKVKDNVDLDPTQDIEVYVSAPAVHRFEASGACHINSDNTITSTETVDIHLSGASGAILDVHAPAVDADLSGACSIELKGETKSLSIDGSGSAEARCFGLMAENVEIDISGAGDVETFASVKLHVEVSGAGSVKYKGNPAVSQSISGAGSVSKAN
jgi:hypothetical protein